MEFEKSITQRHQDAEEYLNTKAAKTREGYEEEFLINAWGIAPPYQKRHAH